MSECVLVDMLHDRQHLLGLELVSSWFTNVCFLDLAGASKDLQESFVIAEVIKYLFLLFADAGEFVNYFVLSTEAHPMPVFGHPPPAPPANIPRACQKLCRQVDEQTERKVKQRLQKIMFLLVFNTTEARLLRSRRCHACIVTTRARHAYRGV